MPVAVVPARARCRARFAGFRRPGGGGGSGPCSMSGRFAAGDLRSPLTARGPEPPPPPGRLLRLSAS